MKRPNLIRKYKKEYEKAIQAIKEANLDPEQYIDHIPKPGKTRKFSTREISIYLKDLESINEPNATEIVNFRGSNIPAFYKEIFQRAKNRYNRNTDFLNRMKLNKFKNPSPEYSPFLDYASKIIERASPEYRRKREDQYKSNYLKAVEDSLSHTDKGRQLKRLIQSIPARKLIDTYHTKGNEDLGIINIYPGDPEQADLQSEYLIERWNEVLSG